MVVGNLLLRDAGATATILLFRILVRLFAVDGIHECIQSRIMKVLNCDF